MDSLNMTAGYTVFMESGEWHVSDRDMGWLEGIIDGEGYLGIVRKGPNQYGAKLYIVNTNPEIIERAHRIIAGGTSGRDTAGNRKHKEKYYVDCTTEVLRKILPEMELTGKERQRKILLAYLPLSRLRKKITRRKQNMTGLNEMSLIFYNAMRSLNKRGPTNAEP